MPLTARLLLFFVVTYWLPASAQLPLRTGADSLAAARLQATVDQFRAGPALRHGTLALSIKRARDGATVFDYNTRQSLSTASTLKLITTATALAVLGPSYTYNTTLEYDGTVRDSVLTGNVYVRGTGDPALGSWRFTDYADLPTLLRTWSDGLRGAGIRQIQGAVIGDASLYDHPFTPDTWPWGDLGNYYGASPSALNINENLYRVFFRPGRAVGAAASVSRTDPALPYLSLHNRVTTDAAGTGDQVTIYGAPLARQHWLEGKVPLGPEFSVKGALPDPAFHVAYALTEQLTRDSIRVSQPPLSYHYAQPAPKTASKRTVLYTHKSPPLVELAQQTNYQSINLYAEALLQTTARTLTKRSVTTDEAVQAVTSFWKGRGVTLDGFRIKDGSGLSAVGAMTADNMTGILAAMSRDKAFASFYETIPVVGESGTVRSLARNTAAAGNVRAKSGSIEGVRAYAGYYTAPDGELMTFAVFVSRFTPGQNRAVTAQLERIMAQMIALTVPQP